MLSTLSTEVAKGSGKKSCVASNHNNERRGIKCKFGTMSANMRRCGTKLSLRPFLTKEAAIPLAKQIFGLEVDDTSTVKELESYDDRNFLMKGQILGCWPKAGSKFQEGVGAQKYLFKVMHSRETYRPGFLDAVIGAMQHLHVHLGRIHYLFVIENGDTST